MSIVELEYDMHDIINFCSFSDRVLVVVVLVQGSPCTSVMQAANAIMEYKCVEEYFDQQQALKFHMTAGSQAHLDFVDMYAFSYAPVIIVLGKRGVPSGIVKIDPECESYCALLVKHAISEGLRGGNTTWQLKVKATLDKSCNTMGVIIDEPMEVSLDTLEVDVFERNEIACDVAAQCSIWTPKTTQKPFKRRVDSVQDGTEPTKNTAKVWSVARSTSLSPGTASRLMIIVPKEGPPMHAATSKVATMQDVSLYISRLLKIPSHSLEISTRYPHHIFSDDEMSKKMDELGLVPTAVLLVKMKAALVQQTWGLSDVIHPIVVTITRPFLAISSGFWSWVQSIFYSSSEEDETDEDDDNEDSPPRQPKNRIRTLFDGDDDDKDRVPNYNGNSTQLL